MLEIGVWNCVGFQFFCLYAENCTDFSFIYKNLIESAQ